MKKLYTFLLGVCCLTGVSAQSLSGVESVEYDPSNNRYLASSDNSSIVAIAPNGALSYFGSGTDADYGMEVIGNVLYVISNNGISAYNLTTELPIFSQTITGAQFLNGMANNGTDSIWFTDFNAKDILVMDVNAPQDYSTLVTNTVEAPNGIVYDGENNRCVFTTWGTPAHIKAIDLTTNAVTYLVQNAGVGSIDGIDKDAQGNWYISSWSPARITKFSNDFVTSEVITVSGISNPADICYSPETDTLAIPGGNQVLFVGFENSSVGIDEENFESYVIQYHSGNPIVKFDLAQSQDVVMEMIDLNGRLVHPVLEGMQPKGAQTVVLSSIGLYSGAYICRMTSKELSFSERIIIP